MTLLAVALAALAGTVSCSDHPAAAGQAATVTTTTAPSSSGPSSPSAAPSTSSSLPPSSTPPASTPPSSTPPAVVQSASGKFTVAPGTGPAALAGRQVKRYTVEIEDGLPENLDGFAKTVQEILADPRSWSFEGRIAFQRVDSGPVDIRVTLASPDTVDRLCAPMQTGGEVSCWNGHRAVINQARWELAVPHFGGDLTTYRTYAINHEVGHGIGKQHTTCPGPGKPAPVMVQQTFGLQGCTPNGWPSVSGG
ncbi:DUF3152 domain-containing protein [Solihabitans fulvus]|uniref:DUF3152 domain-containing protein n=2 Tax=Solihabitans fulvus TaxID=1892852 RepID=A0A5B2XRB7_9PSEU|nr:DUF3152 domain-containing protein [Solihabitans fulvus]